MALAFFAPGGTVFDDPIQKSFLKTDVLAHFLAFDPFVAEDFFPLGEEFLVEDGILDEIGILVFGDIVHIQCSFHKKTGIVNLNTPKSAATMNVS